MFLRLLSLIEMETEKKKEGPKPTHDHTENEPNVLFWELQGI